MGQSVTGKREVGGDCFKTGGQGNLSEVVTFQLNCEESKSDAKKESSLRKKRHLEINGISARKEDEAEFCVFYTSTEPLSTEKHLSFSLPIPPALCASREMCFSLGSRD